MTERSKRIGKMIRRGMRTPEGSRAPFYWDASSAGCRPSCTGSRCPCLLSVPSWSLPGWGHQLPLPVPARRCPDQWPPAPGCSLFSSWFSIHPQALRRHHFVHGCKELKPHPPMLAVREFPHGQRRLDPAAPTLIPGDSTSPVAPLRLPALTSLLVPLLLRLRAPRSSHSPQAHPKSEPVLPRPKSSWAFPNCSGAH